MGLRRLRSRLDSMQSQASNTMFSAQEALALVKEILKDVEEDGVEISLIRTGEGTLIDFMMGRISELPIKVQIKP